MIKLSLQCMRYTLLVTCLFGVVSLMAQNFKIPKERNFNDAFEIQVDFKKYKVNHLLIENDSLIFESESNNYVFHLKKVDQIRVKQSMFWDGVIGSTALAIYPAFRYVDNRKANPNISVSKREEITVKAIGVGTAIVLTWISSKLKKTKTFYVNKNKTSVDLLNRN